MDGDEGQHDSGPDISLRELLARADNTLRSRAPDSADPLTLHELSQWEDICARAASLVESGSLSEGVILWQRAVDALHSRRSDGGRECASMYYAQVPLMAEARIAYARRLVRHRVSRTGGSGNSGGSGSDDYDDAARQCAVALQWLARLLQFAQDAQYERVAATSDSERAVSWRNARVEELEYMFHGGDLRSLVVLIADAMTALGTALMSHWGSTSSSSSSSSHLKAGNHMRALYVCWAGSYGVLSGPWIKDKMCSVRDTIFLHYWSSRQRAAVLFARLSALMGNYADALRIAEEDMDGSGPQIDPLERLLWQSCVGGDSSLESALERLYAEQRSLTLAGRFARADAVNRGIAEIRAREAGFVLESGGRLPDVVGMVVRQFHSADKRQAFLSWYRERANQVRQMIESMQAACQLPVATRLDALVRTLRQNLFGPSPLFPDGELLQVLRQLEAILLQSDSLVQYTYHMQCYHALFRLRVQGDTLAASRELDTAVEMCPPGSDAHIELLLAKGMVAVERGKDGYDTFSSVFKSLQKSVVQLTRLGLRSVFHALYFRMHIRSGAAVVPKLLTEQSVMQIIGPSTHGKRGPPELLPVCRHLSAALLDWLDRSHRYDERKFQEAKERFIGPDVELVSPVIDLTDERLQEHPSRPTMSSRPAKRRRK